VGGDEFVILAVGVSEMADAVSLAERIQARIEEPFDLPNGVVSIGASIGVALAGPGSNADALLHEADLAMYGVKEPGRAVSHY
jgi:diguanylate cyclase (GGDEF)-like protein